MLLGGVHLCCCLILLAAYLGAIHYSPHLTGEAQRS